MAPSKGSEIVELSPQGSALGYEAPDVDSRGKVSVELPEGYESAESAEVYETADGTRVELQTMTVRMPDSGFSLQITVDDAGYLDWWSNGTVLEYVESAKAEHFNSSWPISVDGREGIVLVIDGRRWRLAGRLRETRLSSALWDGVSETRRIPYNGVEHETRCGRCIMGRTISIGAQSYADLRESGCFIVDKTGFIGEWWRNRDQVTLVCRPRRFGKTLNLPMLECFLSTVYADRGEELFDGTEALIEGGPASS